MVIRIIDTVFKLYYFLIILRILISWVPIGYDNQFIKPLYKLTDPYLNIFRKIIPPIGMIDFSPIIAIIVLDILKQLFYRFI